MPDPVAQALARGRGARPLVVALICGACSGPPGAGRSLGDDLGTFNVAATESENSCGAGALGSSQSFEFEVDLARAYSELFWDGRVGGRVDASLAFDFAAEVRIELRATRAPEPGCAVRRHDAIAGVLEERPAAGIVGFTGDMSYAFDADMNAMCTPSDLEGAGLPMVPCRMQYALTAERTRTPDP